MTNITEIQKTLITSLNRHLMAICAVAIVLFIVAQFAVMATLGPKGAEIASMRSEKDELRIQNEYLRSQIDKTRTLGQIESGLHEMFDLQSQDVNLIQTAPETNIVSSVSGL